MTLRFLDSFGTDHRALLEAAAHTLHLTRGEYLMRRGEAGGDVYLVGAGALEVLDHRRSPDMILALLEEGTLVGEMAFLDDTPRSVDVRAAVDAKVLRWARDDLRTLLDRHPDLGAAFFYNLARLANIRVRRLTEGAVAGAFEKEDQREVNQPGVARAREEARLLAERTKAQLLDADTRLRAGAAADPGRVDAVLNGLEEAVGHLFSDQGTPEAHRAASEVLTKELHPYLTRSALAEVCHRRACQAATTADVLAHVHRGRPLGEGPLGEAIDTWLLRRPTLIASRALLEHTSRLCLEILDVEGADAPARRVRAMLVNAGSGELLARLVAGLQGRDVVLTVVDQSHDALVHAEARAADPPGVRTTGVEVVAALENLTQVTMGRLLHRYEPQDLVVVDGLVEYLPDRLAVSLLSHLGDLLAPGGSLVLSTLAPSSDHRLLDRLLGWPTIRRPAEAFEAILPAAGISPTECAVVPEPALLVAARRSPARVSAVGFAPGVHQK